ncbi:hypothetical protein [Bacteroides nordii]|uniref:hypothetical protein n=1 Tax=Bacteroides nordii TaxID=291645 RepID=UPI002A7F6699|nr:hypothetical protein [Bacteroides nordii]
MDDCFIKKYWKEENILFYLHFHNKIAVRQLEISSQGVIHLTTDIPIINEHFLYDQKLEDLELDNSDYISEREFNEKWDMSLKIPIQ